MYRVDSAYVVFDSGISARRRELWQGYKGARYREPGDPYFEPPDPEHTEYLRKFRLQRAMLEFILPKLGVRVVRLKEPHGWEADDLIYALTLLVPSRHILVVSDDKDMFQLVMETEESYVHVVRPIAKQYLKPENFEDILGYPYYEDLLRKAILGDKSDDIPKVPGCGKKGVDSIFEEGAPPCEYPFEEFFIWCMGHKLKKVRAIADNMDLVLRNYELMDLSFEDTTPSHDPLRRIIHTPVSTDLPHVQRFFSELDLLSIVRDLPTWAIAFQRLR
jgi:DNA polymerase-1